MISRFHISTTRPSQSLERLERSVRRTSSVTMPTASSSIAAGSTKAAQLRLARGRPESLSRPCVLLRPPVWHRLTKRRYWLLDQMEGRIKPSPVLNAPPAKESDPFCTSATLLPLRPCRRNTFQKGEFPLHSHPPRARRNAASNRAFSFSQCAISARDLPRELRSGLGCPQRSFRASDE